MICDVCKKKVGALYLDKEAKKFKCEKCNEKDIKKSSRRDTKTRA